MRWIIQSFGSSSLSIGEQRVARVDALAVQRDLDLARLPLQAVVGAAIPDRHRAGAVLALWDLALEVEVLERVVLGVRRRSGCRLGVSGRPFGTAHEASAPSRSRRRSQCRRLALCSWITKRGAALARSLPRRPARG